MRTRTEHLLVRLGYSLALLVLAAFVLLVAGIVVAGVAILGGIAGWVTGIVLGALVAQATRRPVGLLMGRLVDAAG
jgi:type IV secretory pathway TrbL component